MPVCDFCSATYFKIQWIPNKKAIRQVRDLQAWMLSLRAACTVCTLLFEQYKTEVQQTQQQNNDESTSKSSALNDEDPKKKRAALWKIDEHIRSTSVEDLLLEWAGNQANEIESTFQLPAYDVTLQEAGDEAVWQLNFLPVAPSTGATIVLPKQSFVVYDVRFDGKPQQRADQSQKTDNYAQVKKWVSQCQSDGHPLCKQLRKPRRVDDWVPTRLIDVGRAGPNPVLIETQNKNKEGMGYDEYVTLSYCWGYEPDYLLNDQTRDEFMSTGMEIDKMPQTFKDAVTATRSLGVKYLWIDALCMLQQNAEEFLREAPTMRDIYGNSYLSLAAVSAANYQQGLFRQRTGGCAPPCTTIVSWGRRPTECVVTRADFWAGEVLAEPLYSRGWVLQERMLAPRILHCQRRQLIWQCPSLTACEALPEGLSTVIDDERRDELRWRGLFHRGERALTGDERSDLQEIWRQAVTRYTTCNLTKNRDKLMAIAGIAGKMKDMRLTGELEQYFAGLWGHQFTEQLAWRVTEYCPARDPLSYRAPSWSWASADGIITTPVRIEQHRDYTMQIQPGGLHVQWADPNVPTGVFLFASLTAEVELFRPLRFRRNKDSLRWIWTGDEHSSCQLHMDQPITDSFVDSEEVTLSTDDEGECFLECRAAMVTYRNDMFRDEEDHSLKEQRTGFALALRAVRATKARIFCRIGLIVVSNMRSQAWDTLQSCKDVTASIQGEVAPSDDRAKDKQLITLL